MAIYNPDDHAQNLPDAYEKSHSGNNFKVLEIERCAVNDFRTTLQQIFTSLDLDQATGKTLDLYGDTVGQARGLATDDQYILMIKARIMRSLSNGSYKSILQGICATFDCEASQVLITEEVSACVVRSIALPLSIITRAGLTVSQTVEIVKKMLPIGVRLETFLFEGTFEFASSEGETDNNKGFADDGGTIGGYLGVLGGDSGEPVLPI